MKISSLRTSVWLVAVFLAALPALTSAQQSHAPTEQWQLADEQQFYFNDPEGPFSGIFRTRGFI